ncbi:MAG: hypothetical protein EZS28_056498, partial [Streblomastix strix]
MVEPPEFLGLVWN